MNFQDYQKVSGDGPAFTPSPLHKGVWDFQPGDGWWYRVQPVWRGVLAWRGSGEPTEIGGVIVATYDRLKVHSFGRVDPDTEAVLLFAAQLFAGFNPQEPECLRALRRP